MEIKMNTCFEAAHYFLKRQIPEAGDLMSNLKLQKLVYYAQGFYLAIMDSPLFNEKIEAWEHGPVCVPLYHRYKEFGSDAIDIPYDVDAYGIFDKKTHEILDMVHKYYGQFSAWKLRNLTHEDIPWINAYRQGSGTEITHKDMGGYFKMQLVEDEEDR
jgi:uncharacterized phage-associated protein